LIRFATALLTVVLLVSACVGTTCGCVTGVTVFGASSLAKPLEELKTDFSGSYGVATIFTISTGSSTALRTQIEEGAQADVFLSADMSNPAALLDAGLVDGSIVAFATNHLTIVVPKGNPAGISSPADLGRPGVRVIAAGPEVPIAKYAVQVVAKLAALQGYPADFMAAYESNVVSREENVGAVVAKIALGEGDAALVYVTDGKGADVETIELPADADVTSTYGGVVLRSARGPKAAHAFLEWVRGPNGQRVLANFGFSPAP
jgi:molybdate transport system substrate-binding protein